MKILTILIMIVAFVHATEIEDKIKMQNITVVKSAVEEMRKTLPQKIDKFTTLVGLDSEGEKLIYTYAIDDPKLSDDEIAKLGKKKMKDSVVRGICSSSKRFLESGIAITYRYIGAKSKKPLFFFAVENSDCEL